MTFIEGTESTKHSLSEQIRQAPEDGANLTAILKVRVDGSMEQDLNQVEAFFRGQGYRHASRSHLIRLAIANLISTTREESPELDEMF